MGAVNQDKLMPELHCGADNGSSQYRWIELTDSGQYGWYRGIDYSSLILF